MWICQKCERIFQKAKQPHSCKKVSLESHFTGKEKSKDLFDFLFKQIEKNIGKCKIISMPCCVHLFGKYDFLAALPKKDKLEIRFALDRKLDSPRLKICVPMSSKVFKNCFEVQSRSEIDKEFLGWIRESYHQKD
ncbi:MAG: DUF5655 domain-containing protein [Patescibacteria group bacterium]|nr:hypothetical protein [Patescibacteria group bacterium]